MEWEETVVGWVGGVLGESEARLRVEAKGKQHSDQLLLPLAHAIRRGRGERLFSYR